MLRRKRVRRKANEIQRKFTCPYPNCKKSYGSEGSMLQHMKQKHKKFYVKYCTQNKIKMNIGENEETGSSGSSNDASEASRQD